MSPVFLQFGSNKSKFSEKSAVSEFIDKSKATCGDIDQRSIGTLSSFFQYQQ